MRDYSRESIERALDHHLRGGLIREWRHDPQGRPGRYVVLLHIGDTIDLRSLREAFVFVCGLATARQVAAEVAERDEALRAAIQHAGPETYTF